MSNVNAFPLEWRGAGLTIEMWLEGPNARLLCRMLIDTGATHVSLPMWLTEELGLEAVRHDVPMTTFGAVETRFVSLYRLPLAELPEVTRSDLLVAPIVLPEVPGYHGALGMNWLRSFAHVGLAWLQTNQPVLELHDLT